MGIVSYIYVSCIYGNVYIYTHVYKIHIHVCFQDTYTCMTYIYRSKEPPPPRGGFLFTMFPHQEPCIRGPPSKNLSQILRGGSSYTRLLMREHSKQETPPGGGVLSINMYVYHIYIYIY